MSTIMKTSSFELGTNGAGIDVTSHDDAVTFYVPLTAEQRRDLADALVPGRDFSGVDWKAMYEQAVRERDALDSQLTRVDMECAEAVTARVAAERTCDELRSLIEGQKEHVSKSIEVRDRMRRECDEALRKKGEAFDRAVRAERERDAAVARAEQAENARDAAATRAQQMEKKLAKVMSDYQDVEDERDEWKARAEAAEADNADAKIDDDPAVLVVRESDLPAARVDGDYYVVASAKGDYKWPQHGPSWWADRAQDALAEAARYTSLARLAADREATVDPVEEKARELATIAYPEPGFDGAFDVADADAKGAYRRIAAHVLGQEARR